MIPISVHRFSIVTMSKIERKIEETHKGFIAFIGNKSESKSI